MTADGSDEAGVKRSRELTRLAPDPARAERVRARCRGELERRRGRSAHMTAITGFASRVLVPAAVGAFCVFYVAVLVATTLRFQGIVP
jgi:hypothetical protein